jgi:ABC-type sugar transport system permease subunit
MYKKVPMHKAFRILFVLPSVLSGVVWTNMFRQFMGVKGPIALVWQKVFNLIDPPTFLTDSRYALGAVMLYSIWMGIASNFVLYSGTLTRIPNELIEVGKLEGIKWYQELLQVIVPLVWPTISTVWLMSLMGIFTASGNILLLTNGAYGTNTLSHFLFTRVYNVPESSNLYNYSSCWNYLHNSH